MSQCSRDSRASTSRSPEGQYKNRQRVFLGGGDNPCSIPASLRVATRKLGEIGFPGNFPNGQPIGSSALLYLARSQDLSGLILVEEKLEAAVWEAAACLDEGADRTSTLEYPNKHAVALYWLNLFTRRFYQQAFLAYSLPASRPQGYPGPYLNFCTIGPLFSVLPTPATSSRFIDAQIRSLTLQITHAEELSPRAFVEALTAEKGRLSAVLAQLTAAVLEPDLYPFNTFVHPPEWPAVLCEAIDEWIEKGEHRPY